MIRLLVILGLMGACAAARTPDPNAAPSPDTMSYRPVVHGHRGARALRPENTLPAFAYALEQGVDVLELDMGVTRDGVIIVSHDLYANPVICQRADGSDLPEGWLWREHTLDEVKSLDCGSRRNPRFPTQVPVPGAKIPTLEEVFELVKARGDTRVQFNIETKIKPAHPGWTPPPEEYARLVVETVKKHGMTDRVYLQSFDHRTLRAARRLEPKLRRVQLTSDNLVDFVALAKAEDAHISPDHEWILDEDVRAIQAAGYEVIPWTANTPAAWDRLVALKVDAIITDDPAALISYLKDRGLR